MDVTRSKICCVSGRILPQKKKSRHLVADLRHTIRQRGDSAAPLSRFPDDIAQGARHADL